MSTTSTAKIQYLEQLQAFIEERYGQRDGAQPSQARCLHGLDLRSAISKKLYFKCVDHPGRFQAYQEAVARGEHRIPAWGQRLRWFLRNAWLRWQRPYSSALPTGKQLAVITHEKHRRFLHSLPVEIEQIIDLDHIAEAAKAARVPFRGVPNYLAHLHADIVLLVQAVEDLLDAHQPASIVLVEGNSLYDQVVSLCARRRSIPTTCVQYGWAMVPHTGFRDMQHDRFLSWGSAFSSVLRAFNPCTNFLDVGHPSLPSADHQEASLKVCAMFQAPARWMGHDTFEAFVTLCLQIAEAGIPLDVRPHPAWPLAQELLDAFEAYDHVSIRHSEAVSLRDQLDASTVVLTVFSSVGFESILRNCIPMFFQQHMDLKMHPDLKEIGFKTTFHSTEDALAFLESFKDPTVLRSHQQRVREATSHYFSPFDASTFTSALNSTRS